MHAAAIFDMDGLLIDSEIAIMQAWLRAADAFGVDLSRERYLTVIGRSAPDAFAVLGDVFGGASRFDSARAHVVAHLASTPEEIRYPLKHGASELLAALAALDVPCAVASSSARAEIDARLSAVGIRDRFAAVAGGDEVSRGKPDPAVYTLAAQRLGIAADRCIAFEDSRNGARAALAAGARVVLVPDLVHPPEDLRREVHAVLDSLAQVTPHVGRWFAASTENPLPSAASGARSQSALLEIDR